MPVMFTEKVHEEFDARVAPAKLTKFAPAMAVMVPAPQVPVCPVGLEITRPAGNVSVKPIAESGVPALLF